MSRRRSSFIYFFAQNFKSLYKQLKLRCTAVLRCRGSALYVTNSVNLSGLARRSPDPRGSSREGGRTPGRSNRISRSRANDRTLSRLCSRIGSFVAVVNSILQLLTVLRVLFYFKSSDEPEFVAFLDRVLFEVGDLALSQLVWYTWYTIAMHSVIYTFSTFKSN